MTNMELCVPLFSVTFSIEYEVKNMSKAKNRQKGPFFHFLFS